MGLTRTEGWEGRLAALIEQSRGLRFSYGKHDCFLLAMASVLALTGVDLRPTLDGSYRTLWGSRRVREKYGPDLESALSKFLGIETSSIKLARRGDVCCHYEGRDVALGVCIGSTVAVLTKRGMDFLPLSACAKTWRIG